MTYKVLDCVKQATTSTGTGDLTLGAALSGWLTFPVACVSLDTFCYEVHGVDAGGSRTGEWEVGLGQYFLDGAVHKLRRLFKLSGSNGASGFVSFSAGTKHVGITVAASAAKSLTLDANAFGVYPTFYVRPDGDDANSGLADSAAHAFASLGGALQTASALCRQATIVLAAGTYDGGVAQGRCNLTITGAGAGATEIGHVEAYSAASLSIAGCTIADPTFPGVLASGSETSVYLDAVKFAACPAGHIKAVKGGEIDVGAYEVSGGCSAGAHVVADTGGIVTFFDVTTVSANVTMANGWASCARGLGLIQFDGASFALGGHTVTGPRYDIRANGICNTAGGGASFLPGSTAGSTASGGQYL